MRAKTVNEEVHFEKGQNPKSAMGLGISQFLGETGWWEGPKGSEEEAIEIIQQMDAEAQEAYDMNIDMDSEQEALDAADEVVEYYSNELSAIGWEKTDADY